MAFQCAHCDKCYAHKCTLKKHIYGNCSSSAFSTKKRQTQRRIICVYCEQNFGLMVTYQDHLRNIHHENLELEELDFDSEADFLRWKDRKEIEAACNFVKNSRNGRRKDGSTVGWLHCHRSFHFRKRKPSKSSKSKKLGTNKLGSTCPSQMKVTEINNKIRVLYCGSHLGHEREPARMRLSSSLRASIAEKLSGGVPVRRVIADVKSNLSSEGPITRLHLLSRDDIYNIRKSYNILCSIRLHADNFTSADLLANDLEKLDNNPILLYKKQNEEHEGLNTEDLALIIQTKFQKKMYTKFATKLVSFDSTSKHNFCLYTLLVLDEWNEGIPVAFCVSNRKDQHIFEIFLQKVKGSAGGIETKLFISDDTTAFGNAWEKVMGMPKRKLLSLRHVYRNWTLNLSRVRNFSKQHLIISRLKSISEELDEEKFRKQYDNLLLQLNTDNDTKPYAAYLHHQYSNKLEEWARCLCKHLPADTNMYLEDLHRALKYDEVDGEACIRLDKTIDALFDMIRDKKFDRFKKYSKNLPYKKAKETRERHAKGVEFLCTANIEIQTDNSSWLVNGKYLVTRSLEKTEACCKRMCQECNICIDTYTCSCVDNFVNYFICKHIHACRIKYPMSNSESFVQEFIELEYVNECEVSSTFNPNDDSYSLRNEILSKQALIRELIETRQLSEEGQRKVNKLLDEMISVFQSSEERPTVNSSCYLSY